VQEGKVGPDLEREIHIKPGITDTTPFPLSKTISAAHVVIKPLGVGERPWHPSTVMLTCRRAQLTIFVGRNNGENLDHLPSNEFCFLGYGIKITRDSEVNVRQHIPVRERDIH